MSNTTLDSAAIAEITAKILSGLNVVDAVKAKAAENAKAILDRRANRLQALVDVERDNLAVLANNKPDVTLYDAAGKVVGGYYSERANQNRNSHRVTAEWARKGIELAMTGDEGVWPVIDFIYGGYFDQAKAELAKYEAAKEAAKTAAATEGSK